MRTKKQIFMLLLALLVGIPTLSAQSKKEKKEQKNEAVKKLIESENYPFDIFLLTGNQKRFSHFLSALLWTGLQHPLWRRRRAKF